MLSPGRHSLALLGLLLCATLSACNPAEDPESVRARTAHELARDLMSPYCPGRTLAECPSPDALAVREEIRSALRAGESPDAIRTRIEARFGDQVVGVPREKVGWALPILALVAGAGLLVLALRRAVTGASAKVTPLTAEQQRALERELDDVRPD
jgi:cytochrome c-type biogenesis protein CcmH/NrfF